MFSNMKKRLALLFFRAGIAAGLLSLLTACSGLRLIDTRVQALAAQPTQTQDLKAARYRFERLPSQAASPHVERLEAMADKVLTQVGLVRDDAQATVTILLTLRSNSFLADPWGNPIAGWSWPGYGRSVYGAGGIGSGGSMIGFGMRFPPPTAYNREVSLIFRSLANGQIVYETRAHHSGPWSDTEAIVAAMLEAALIDFPNPPVGIRQVNIEIPR